MESGSGELWEVQPPMWAGDITPSSKVFLYKIVHMPGKLTLRNVGRWKYSAINTNSSERPPCVENLNPYYTFSTQIFPAITFLK